MKIQLFSCLLFICLSQFVSTFAQNVDIQSRLSGVEAELEAVLDSFDAAGFAVSVVDQNGLVYAKGFGYRDYENQVPVDENTLFAIGSCSKAFTSSLLGILRAEEKIDFSDSPSKYLPYFSFYNDEMNNSITIRDMMCHMTGLPRHDLSWYLLPAPSKQELLERVAHQEPFTGVRQNWYYNNFMFLAQGAIAEELTGKSWEENIQEHFFDRLDMERSSSVITGLKEMENASLGYEIKDDSIIKKMDYYDISSMGPAGSINSSVSEMANWVRTWINNGIFEGDTILPARYVREAMSAQSIVGANLPIEKHPDVHFQNYGYGWFLSSYKGHYRVEHGGNIDGFSASTCFFPSDSLGIVVLVNQNGSPVTSVVRNIVTDRILDLEQSDWTAEIKQQRDEALANQKKAMASSSDAQRNGTQPSLAPSEYTGEYSHPGYGSFKIIQQADSLFVELPNMTFWLQHYHYDIFTPIAITEEGIDTTAIPPGLDLRMNFQMNNGGEISGLLWKAEPTLEPIEFERTPSEVAMDVAALNTYVGEYELMGQIATVYIEEEKLYLRVPNQPLYELYAIGEHQFMSKQLPPGFQLTFTVPNGAEQAASVIFKQPNGSFEATRKK